MFSLSNWTPKLGSEQFVKQVQNNKIISGGWKNIFCAMQSVNFIVIL